MGRVREWMREDGWKLGGGGVAESDDRRDVVKRMDDGKVRREKVDVELRM
jgi:hypothetical protein